MINMEFGHSHLTGSLKMIRGNINIYGFSIRRGDDLQSAYLPLSRMQIAVIIR